MLLNRLKRGAGADKGPDRLRLVSTFETVVITVGVLILLAVIFPHKVLIERLTHQERADDVSVSYLENLLRHDDANLDLRLQLAKARADRMDPAGLDRLLTPVERAGDDAQRGAAFVIRFRHVMAQDLPGAQGAAEEILKTLSLYDLPADQLVELAENAATFGRGELAVDFYRRADAKSPDRFIDWPRRAAARALSQGHYRASAEIYFYARQHAHALDEARDLYIAGVGALLADNRYSEAMTDAARYIGDLDHDPQTLRYLVSAARAAGDPRAAVRYARALIPDGVQENAHAP